ncbi:MAG TPA: hypothetical protein VGL23_07535 [Chloroflexota bacterium]
MPGQVAPPGAELDDPGEAALAQVVGQRGDRLLGPEREAARSLAPVEEALAGVRVGRDLLELGEAWQAPVGVQLVERLEGEAVPLARLRA